MVEAKMPVNLKLEVNKQKGKFLLNGRGGMCELCHTFSMLITYYNVEFIFECMLIWYLTYLIHQLEVIYKFKNKTSYNKNEVIF